MRIMELRHGVPVVMAVLLLILTRPALSSRGTTEMVNLSSEETYEIDYRGPETHSSIPPGLAGGHRFKIPDTHNRKPIHG
ncbi:uncharacterized protein LOC143878657 [Tasmannia lanceolata]|uniref:uncharacterized protein LOC143878657 n=1 Tax=Tasmannia lanceolata TaxID=3420 RepID=UPI0040649376